MKLDEPLLSWQAYEAAWKEEDRRRIGTGDREIPGSHMSDRDVRAHVLKKLNEALPQVGEKITR